VTGTPCPRCTKNTTDGLLCHPCAGHYLRARKDLTRFTPELRTAWLRLDQVARGNTHGDRSLELAAVEAAEAARVPAMLRTRDAQVALPANPLPVDLDAGALYRQALDWLATTPPDAAGIRVLADAPLVIQATRRLAQRVEEAIDRREPELYLGACDAPDTVHVESTVTEDGVVTFEVSTTDRVCGVDLYGRAGDTAVTCRACGYEYPITARREQMLAEVRNLLERPKVIADALTSLDLPITANTLDKWISRDKRMQEQGREWPDGLPLILADPVYDDDGKPLYRVGAVIDRIEAMRAKSEQTG